MSEMSFEQRELFRIALLRVLDANHSKFGLGKIALATLITTYGFRVQTDQVQREIEYMEDPAVGLVVGVDKRNFSTENGAWKITAIGMNFLAERGF